MNKRTRTKKKIKKRKKELAGVLVIIPITQSIQISILTMSLRLGVKSWALRPTNMLLKSTVANSHGQLSMIRHNSTKTTIYDQVTGKTIPLADPEHPEWADYKNPPAKAPCCSVSGGIFARISFGFLYPIAL